MKTINLNNIITVNYKGANINILKLRDKQIWPTFVEPVFQTEWHWHRSQGWYAGGPGNVTITYYSGNVDFANFEVLWRSYAKILTVPDSEADYYEYRTDMPDGSYFITRNGDTREYEIIQYYK